MEEKVEKVLNCAIDRVNELLPTGESLSKEKDTVLLGQGGKLDSMGFVNLVVAIEEELEKQLGTTPPKSPSPENQITDPSTISLVSDPSAR